MLMEREAMKKGYGGGDSKRVGGPSIKTIEVRAHASG